MVRGSKIYFAALNRVSGMKDIQQIQGVVRCFWENPVPSIRVLVLMLYSLIKKKGYLRLLPKEGVERWWV